MRERCLGVSLYVSLIKLHYRRCMQKNSTILFFLVSFSVSIFAQNATWVRNNLTWDRFQGVPDKVTDIPGELHHVFRYGIEFEKWHQDTTIEFYVAFFVVDTLKSWVDPANKTDAYLKYFQVMNDLAELYRLKFQWELNHRQIHFDPFIIDEEIMLQYKLAKVKYMNASGFGKNADAVGFWSDSVYAEIQDYKEKGAYPNVRNLFKEAVHLGLNIGGGFPSINGSLNEYVGAREAFVLGAYVAKKKYMLLTNFQFGQTYVTSDYNDRFGNALLSTGKKARLFLMDVSAGYSLSCGRMIKLTPFAGLGFTQLSGRGSEEDGYSPNGLLILDMHGTCGIVGDFSLPGRINFTKGVHYVYPNLRARVFVSNPSFFPNLRGTIFNASLHFGINTCPVIAPPPAALNRSKPLAF